MTNAIINKVKSVEDIIDLQNGKIRIDFSKFSFEEFDFGDIIYESNIVKKYANGVIEWKDCFDNGTRTLEFPDGSELWFNHDKIHSQKYSNGITIFHEEDGRVFSICDNTKTYFFNEDGILECIL